MDRLRQRRFHRQGNPIAIPVYIDDLGGYYISGFQLVGNFFNVLRCDFGNMYQTVHTGNDLRKGAVFHQLNNLCVHNVVHMILLAEQLDGIILRLLIAK